MNFVQVFCCRVFVEATRRAAWVVGTMFLLDVSHCRKTNSDHVARRPEGPGWRRHAALGRGPNSPRTIVN